MDDIITGQTVYEQILSLNEDNVPVPSATFDIAVYKDGLIYTGLTVNMALEDASRGLFSANWSASTTGSYQLYFENDLTNVVFVTNTVVVRPDSDFDQNTYIGL